MATVIKVLHPRIHELHPGHAADDVADELSIQQHIHDTWSESSFGVKEGLGGELDGDGSRRLREMRLL